LATAELNLERRGDRHVVRGLLPAARLFADADVANAVAQLRRDPNVIEAPALVDGGNPVMKAKTISSKGSVSEGGGQNPVSGYSLIKADSLDAAVKLARECPVLSGGGSIEVAETFNAM